MTQIWDEVRERGGVVEAGQGVGKKNLPRMGYFIGYRCIYFCYIRSMSLGSLCYLFECNHTEFFFSCASNYPKLMVVSSSSPTYKLPTVKPSNPNIKIQKFSFVIPIHGGGENLLKYQLDSSSVIMSLILMTTLFYKIVILQAEIWCSSLRA